MENEEKINLKRGRFWIRMGLATAMGVAGGVIAAFFNEDTRTMAIAANGLALFIIVIFALAYFVFTNTPDEFERRIEIRAFADASLLVIAWLVITSATDQLISGANGPNIFRAPGLMIFLQILIAQYRRRYFALEKEETLKNKWFV